MLKNEFNSKVVVNAKSEKSQLIDLIDELKSGLDDKIFKKDANLFDAEIIELSQELDKLIVEHIKSLKNKQ